MAKNKTINIDIVGSVNLSIDEVWPDGDAPENPTVDDVIKVIKSDTSSLSDLLSFWSLEDSFDVVVCFDGQSKDVSY